MIKMTIEEMRKVTLNVKLFDRETCLKIAKEKNKNGEHLTDEVLLLCLPEDAFGNAHRCFVRKSGVAIWYNGKYSGYKNGYRGNYLDVPDCFIEYAFVDGIGDKGEQRQ